MDVYLRDYDINPGLMPEFLENWGPASCHCARGAVSPFWAPGPTRRATGSSCVLGYAGPGDIDTADEHYQALPEHQPIAQESSRIVKEAHITRLAAVERA